MAELFGAIERALGSGLNAVYEATGSYLLAIILVTVVVRALLIPLTVKQTRSMKKMQELQPQTKAIQRKYKELQQKAKDRQELQQIRMDMNREMQGLYKEAGVHPLGGCFPLLAQMPVFIAMFSIMRASISIFPQTATLVDGGSIAEAFGGKERETVCRPWDEALDQPIRPLTRDEPPSVVACFVGDDTEPKMVSLSGFQDKFGEAVTSAPWVTMCHPTKVTSAATPSGSSTPTPASSPEATASGTPTPPPADDGSTVAFVCQSAKGTGHVPDDGELFRDLATDDATLVGLLPGCSANEIAGDTGLRRCTSTKEPGSGTGPIPYYVLVGLIAASSFYQTKQMQARQKSGVPDQQRMMTRIMPVMFGFISLSIPAGANTYFLASNLWTIGQQYVMFRNQGGSGSGSGTGSGGSGSGSGSEGKQPIESRPAKQKPSQQGSKSPNRTPPKGRSGRNRNRKRR